MRIKFQKTNISENQLVLGGCSCTLFKSALLCCCMLCNKLSHCSVFLTAVQRTQLPFDNENSGVFFAPGNCVVACCATNSAAVR